MSVPDECTVCGDEYDHWTSKDEEKSVSCIPHAAICIGEEIIFMHIGIKDGSKSPN